MLKIKTLLLIVCAMLFLAGCGDESADMRRLDDPDSLKKEQTQEMDKGTMQENKDESKSEGDTDQMKPKEGTDDQMKPEDSGKDDGMKQDDTMKKDDNMKEGMDKTMPEKNSTEEEKTSGEALPMPAAKET